MAEENGKGWQTPAIYETTRAVEFALAAIQKFPGREQVILEYVGEVEHGAGTGYWTEEIQSLADALEDFQVYLDNLED